MLRTISALPPTYRSQAGPDDPVTHGPQSLGARTRRKVPSQVCAYVLLPDREISFGLDPHDMHHALAEIDDVDEVVRRLAYWLTTRWAGNQTKLDTLDGYYGAATVALLLQLALWSAALATTLP